MICCTRGPSCAKALIVCCRPSRTTFFWAVNSFIISSASSWCPPENLDSLGSPSPRTGSESRLWHNGDAGNRADLLCADACQGVELLLPWLSLAKKATGAKRLRWYTADQTPGFQHACPRSSAKRRQ